MIIALMKLIWCGQCGVKTNIDGNVEIYLGFLGKTIIFSVMEFWKRLMSTLKEIEAAILTLPPDEFQQLMQWFFNLDYQRWDDLIEKDIADGKLEDLAQEAISKFEAGQFRAI